MSCRGATAIGMRFLMCLAGLVFLLPLRAADSERIDLLDAALRRVQRSSAMFNYARSSEAYFLAVGRSFTIEDVLTNPFYAPALTQVYASRLGGQGGLLTPWSLFSNAFEMTGSTIETFDPPITPSRSLMDVLDAMQYEFGKTHITPGTRKYLDDKIQSFPKGLEEPLILICEALMSAVTLRNQAIADLSPRDRADFLMHPLSYCVSAPPMTQVRLLQHPGPDHLDIVKTMQRIDMHKMALGMKLMAEAIEISRSKFDYVIKQITGNAFDGMLLEFHSPIGPLLIGGTGINRYDMDAALIVDLDGSDFYSNNAGGSLPVKGGVACVIDMSGNDVYYNPQVGVQGSGALGIGILVDYRGSDSYLGGDLSQGAAVGGIGLLYDEKDSDTYTSGVFTQGAGLFGIGIIADIDGDDFFAMDSLGQGFGSTQGIGILSNIKGNDNYSAGVDTSLIESRFGGIGQGVALGIRSPRFENAPNFWGGIGLLVDRHGNDTYQAGQYAQGASRTLGIGALVDSDGDDSYTALRYSQGAASYLAMGLLIDQAGADQYHATSDSQGFGDNRAAGFLLDYSGNDRYSVSEGCGQGYGRSPMALGLHIDYRGDDRYDGSGYSQGDILAPAEPFYWPTGILINHDGQDVYLYRKETGAVRGDNVTWVSRLGAVGVDTALPPVMYFANQTGKSRQQLYDMAPIPELEDPNLDSSRLGSSDYFHRFHALSRVLHSKKRVIPAIIKSIDLGHNEYRRLLLEGILITLYSSQIVESDIQDLAGLVAIDDPDLKRFFCEITEFRHLDSIRNQLRSLLTDRDPDVRRDAIWTVGRLRDRQSIAMLEDIANDDSDARCRAEAIGALGVLAPEEHLRLFLDKLEDPEDIVQYTCLHALGSTGRGDAIATLQLWTSSEDLHFRRCAARSLVQLGEKTGLPVLIDSLRFLSLDNSMYSSDNLALFLMQYTNVDFGFDQASWEKWWLDSERSLQLAPLIRSRTAYVSLLDQLPTLTSLQIQENLTQLRQQYPGYRGCDIVLSEALQEQATIRVVDPAFGATDAIPCIRLAIELDDIPKFHQTLIEIIAGTGNLQQALTEINASMKIHPRSEELFKLRLHIQNLLK